MIVTWKVFILLINLFMSSFSYAEFIQNNLNQDILDTLLSSSSTCTDWTVTSGSGSRVSSYLTNTGWIQNASVGCTDTSRLFCVTPNGVEF